jgi:hypothetical protein
VVEASLAAMASTSQRALLTLAADANIAPSVGKITTVKACPMGNTPDATGRNSTSAAVAAAQRPPRALVKGRIAPDLAP